MGLPGEVRRLLDRGIAGSGPVVFLTGAGISAESGIPTFRGEEGYWQVGSKHYRPEDLATFAAFSRIPNEVWSWYLYRRSVCRAAEPNAAHNALLDLERGLRDRLVIVTQNVDGLHLRAGSMPHQTYEVHGNIDFMRHDEAGHIEPVPLPEELDIEWNRGRLLTPGELELLRHPEAGTLARPHVLWFDEAYDEPRFRFHSSLKAAEQASLLVIVGSSGVTNLPLRMAATAVRTKTPVVVLNRDEDSAFVEIAREAPYGAFWSGLACELVPAVSEYLMAYGLDRIA